MLGHHLRPTGTILDRILERTVEDLVHRKRAMPLEALEETAAARIECADFRQALAGEGLSVVAEVKRASPSKGLFPTEVEPRTLTSAYLGGGAAAISCLTDTPFFQGSLADLRAVAEIAHGRTYPAPVLRKDFIVDRYQVVEAKAHGADAVLLIVAALSNEMLQVLREEAELLGLATLVEVHDEAELERAMASGARIIGINNRDLRTFVVDLHLTERLAPQVPPGTLIVAESGVATPADAARMARAGADAVLVGEGLILQADRAAAVQALLQGV